MHTPQTQRQRVNSIHLAQDIEKLFNLELHALYQLPPAAQLAIIAKAGQHDLARVARQQAEHKIAA